MLPFAGSCLILNFCFQWYLPPVLLVLLYSYLFFNVDFLSPVRSAVYAFSQSFGYSFVWLLLCPRAWFQSHCYSLWSILCVHVAWPLLSLYGYARASPPCLWFLKWTLHYLSPFVVLMSYPVAGQNFLLSWYLVSLGATCFRVSTVVSLSPTKPSVRFCDQSQSSCFALPVSCMVLSAVQLSMYFCKLYGHGLRLLRIFWSLRNESFNFASHLLKSATDFALVRPKQPPDPIVSFPSSCLSDANKGGDWDHLVSTFVSNLDPLAFHRLQALSFRSSSPALSTNPDISPSSIELQQLSTALSLAEQTLC